MVLLQEAQEYGFKVIEDASHAIGGCWNGRFIGDCQYSDISDFSFHPVQIITTAEGGLLTTRDERTAERLADLRSHGITRNKSRLYKQDNGDWYYEQQSLGFNYRMTELQAALGVSQMSALSRFVTRRHELVNRYDEGLAGLPILKPWQHPESYSAFHLYVIQVTENGSIKRRALFDTMRNAKVQVNVHYIPIHLHPHYLQMGYKVGDFPIAEAYYERALSLPLYAGLSDCDQDSVIAMLKEFFQ